MDYTSRYDSNQLSTFTTQVVLNVLMKGPFGTQKKRYVFSYTGVQKNVDGYQNCEELHLRTVAKPKSGAPRLPLNSISAYGLRMNVITLQIPHPFWTYINIFICSKLFSNNNYNIYNIEGKITEC